MKILTANIALGLRDMDHLIPNLRGVCAYHSWTSFLVAILCPPLRGRWGGPSRSSKRIEYLRKHDNLSATLRLIEETAPDIVILNEVLPEIHGPRLDQHLRDLGYVHITYGFGAKYSDAHVSTLVATKEEAAPLPAVMPQQPYPGCGGGIAAVRTKSGISIIGAHMALDGTDLWRQQLQSIVNLVASEQSTGNTVIFAGDCNEIETQITPSLSRCGLFSVDTNKTLTCPTSLPHMFQKSVDHIYVPKTWVVRDFQAIPFGSDHLALCVAVNF